MKNYLIIFSFEDEKKQYLFLKDLKNSSEFIQPLLDAINEENTLFFSLGSCTVLKYITELINE